MVHTFPILDHLREILEAHSYEYEASSKPIVGIDECASNSQVGSMCTTLIREGLVHMTTPLWRQLHQDENGRTSMFQGSANNDLRQHLNLGKPVKGHSWPDKHIVGSLLAQLGTSDSVVLITENRRRDKGGLRDILDRVVRPAFSSATYGHLALHVYMKRGRTSWSAYTDHVLEKLRAGPLQRGYFYEEK